MQMTASRFLVLLLGAEFFPFLRIRPGRGVALIVAASICVKHYFYQFLPLAPFHITVLHYAAFFSLAYAATGLFSGIGRIRWLYLPAWYTGSPLLSLCGLVSDKTTYFRLEPVAVWLTAWLLMMSASPEAVTAFYPWWFYVGLAPVDELGRIVTAYGKHLPQWFSNDALIWGWLLPFMTATGFSLHTRHCDWPASPEYRAKLRAAQEEQALARGELTFSTVEEVQ